MRSFLLEWRGWVIRIVAKSPGRARYLAALRVVAEGWREHVREVFPEMRTHECNLYLYEKGDGPGGEGVSTMWRGQ